MGKKNLVTRFWGGIDSFFKNFRLRILNRMLEKNYPNVDLTMIQPLPSEFAQIVSLVDLAMCKWFDEWPPPPYGTPEAEGSDLFAHKDNGVCVYSCLIDDRPEGMPDCQIFFAVQELHGTPDILFVHAVPFDFFCKHTDFVVRVACQRIRNGG